MPDTRRCPNPKVVVTRELADAVLSWSHSDHSASTVWKRAGIPRCEHELAQAIESKGWRILELHYTECYNHDVIEKIRNETHQRQGNNKCVASSSFL
jgi:hypothetical protein